MNGLMYEAETGEIINACMAVHKELGNGFLEAVRLVRAEQIRMLFTVKSR